MEKNQKVRIMLCNVFCVIWVYIWDGIDDYRLNIYENMSYDGKLDTQQETTEYISRNISLHDHYLLTNKINVILPSNPRTKLQVAAAEEDLIWEEPRSLLRLLSFI
jgi:hypothetical protein